mmetsp:Transcript_8506/g.21963  ORF Transcript_8506/g.21963 Transcript_8506/m.21963 type:complete len:258 (+) Transcript_8506:26-799(+)
MSYFANVPNDVSAVDAVASGQLHGLDDHQQQILRRSLSELGLLDAYDCSDDDTDTDGGRPTVAPSIIRPRVRTDPTKWGGRRVHATARSSLTTAFEDAAIRASAPAAAPQLMHPRPVAAASQPPLPPHHPRHSGSPPMPPQRSPPPPPTAPPPRHSSPPASNRHPGWSAPIAQRAPMTTFAVPIGATPPPPPPGPPPRPVSSSTASPPPPPGPPPSSSKARTSPPPPHMGAHMHPAYMPIAAHVVPMLVTVPVAPPR